MVSSVLRLQTDGPRANVTLCRPEVHNALNAALLDAIAAAFREVATRHDVRYVVLTGDGPSFCAGADVHWMRASLHASVEENRADAARLIAALGAITTCPKPVIAQVDGAALGGGVGLVAACDLAVAVPAAVFGLTEVRLGLVPAMIFPFLLQKVAPHHLRWAALTGDRFPAQRALEMGLVNEVADDVAAVIDRWADSLLAAGPHAAAGVKELFRAIPHLSPDAARSYAIELSAGVRAGQEAQEGMLAFLERRKPSWKP
jgi:methylglutaconyl-CoA hydratase